MPPTEMRMVLTIPVPLPSPKPVCSSSHPLGQSFPPFPLLPRVHLVTQINSSSFLLLPLTNGFTCSTSFSSLLPILPLLLYTYVKDTSQGISNCVKSYYQMVILDLILILLILVNLCSVIVMKFISMQSWDLENDELCD